MDFLSSTHNETSFLNSTRSLQSSGRRQATGTPIQRSMSTQSLDRNYPPAVPTSSPRDLPIQDRSTPASAQLLTRPPISPITKEPRQKTARDHYISRRGSNQGTLQTLDKSEPIGSDKLNGNFNTLLASDDEPSDMKRPGTAAGNSSDDKRLTRTDVKSGLPQDFENPSMSVRHDYSVPRLDLTDVQYSHRGPPSIRTSESTDFKASIWYVHDHSKSRVCFICFGENKFYLCVEYGFYYKGLSLFGTDSWDVPIANLGHSSPFLTKTLPHPK